VTKDLVDLGRATAGMRAYISLPVDAVTETFGILGIKGSGKSTTAKQLVEQLTKVGQKCVIIDPMGSWWGLKASADGKSEGLPFTILGGDRADVPITPKAGELIADLVIDTESPLIIDLSLMRKGQRTDFMEAFAEKLYYRNREPVMLVLDECDLLVPQMVRNDLARLVGAIEDIVRRGRQRGIGCTLISQRPASINKGVLSQVSTLVCHRLAAAHDRKAIDDWVTAQADPISQQRMMAELAKMPAGTAWVWSPSWLDLFERLDINMPSTFDSFETPKAGQKRIEPKVLSKPDIDALEAKLKQVIEEAEENDPKALRRRISELERELANRQPQVEVQTVEVEKVIERVVVPDMVMPGLDSLRSRLGGVVEAIDSLCEDVAAAIYVIEEEPLKERPVGAGPESLKVKFHQIAAVKPVRVQEPSKGSGDDIVLRAGPRRILEALIRQHPMRLTLSQVGVLSKLKTSSGTFSTYKSELLRGGYVEINDGEWTVTQRGFDYMGEVPKQPMTTEEILAMWRGVLRAGPRKMLDVLLAAYPDSVLRTELATAVEMVPTSGTFSTYLSDLRRNGLAEVEGQAVRASSIIVQ
jgi:hypothetical protein